MKLRIIATLLALAMTLPLLLTACDTGSGNDTTGPATGEGTNATDETTVGGPNGDDTSEPTPPDDGTPYDGFVLTVSADGKYGISDNIFGLFLEDINHAVDGGLYAELIFNRSFEYADLATNGGKQGWTRENIRDTVLDIIDGSADGTWLNENNPHYARLTNKSDTVYGIYNSGYYEGISLIKDAEYNFTVYARAVDGYKGKLYVSLEAGEKVYAEGEIDALTGEWHKYSLTLKANNNVKSGIRVKVKIDNGTVDLDMVSLFPADTYKGRENGLRRDLAEMLEAMKPKFLRFPGGCIIEGQTLETAYDWKDSIGNGLEFEINGVKTVGDVATRPIGVDIWADHANKQADAYYMTYGLGFYEYFLLCEDLGCEPIPILNCGLSCQGRPNPSGPKPGTPEFQEYIDDALDLVEFCMGGTDTEWGAIRAAMGHPEPFKLTYIGIGNEQWGNDYNTRYAKFREAFNAAKESNPELYGNIKLIMANGLTSGSRDGWDVVAKDKNIADSLDEHYYNPSAWFLMNEHRYDAEYYDRTGPTVFIGEYAVRGDVADNCSRAAIVEAAYMTSLERNGDIVELAAYAPLFAYNGHIQWGPDLIWYDGETVWGSVNYYVQKIYSTNQSKNILPSTLDGSGCTSIEPLTGKVGLGTWATSARFSDLVVTDNATGEVLLNEDFSSSQVSDFDVIGGNFGIRNSILVQSNTGYPSNDITGDVLYIGDKTWSNYTMTFKARKMGGGEGFIIPFAVKDQKNFWHWNIGGWFNTTSALEYVENGVKSGKVSGTEKPFVVETNHDYEIKITIDGYRIRGYIDGELMIDFEAADLRGVYSVVGEDDNDIIIKLVNIKKNGVSVKIDVSAVSSYTGEAKVEFIDFKNASVTNDKAHPTRVSIEEKTTNVSGVFEYSLDDYSMAVIRIPKG